MYSYIIFFKYTNNCQYMQITNVFVCVLNVSFNIFIFDTNREECKY